MTPFLSITIPTYNRAALLRQALDAILDQVAADPEIEVVISDNASPDDTERLGLDYVQRFPRVRYFRNPSNLGVNANLTACLQRAEGEYVSYFSDDDLPKPGHFEAIKRQLKDGRPTLLYVNHEPFYNDNPLHVGAPMAPLERVMLTDGSVFYRRFGLGFLSALTVRADLARTFIGIVVEGRGTAHLDIVARMALVGPGPFVYDGNVVVLARNNESSYANILRYGFLNVSRLHQDLRQEGLLTDRDLKLFRRRAIMGGLPRSVLADRCAGDGGPNENEVRSLYWEDPLYYLLAYPLLVLPRSWIRAVALPLRSCARGWRRWCYAR